MSQVRKRLGAALTLVCLGISGPLCAATLTEELNGLVQNHPLIQSGQDQVQSANKGVLASLAPYLPSVDLTGDEGRGRVSMPAFRASSGPFTATEENWNLAIKENLWDGGARDSQRAQAKIQQDIANITLVGVRQTVLGEGIAAYMNVLRANELVRLSQQNADNIRRQLNLEDERVRRGTGIAVDVLQAKSRLQISLERLRAVEGGLRDATTRYEQVFNHPPTTAEMRLTQLPANALPPTLDEAVATSLGVHPTVQTADRQIDLARERREAIEAEYHPRFDLVGQRTYQQDWAGIPGIRRDTMVEVRTTWNLFGGLGTRNRAQQSGHDYEARKDDSLQAKRKTEEQVKLAWNALKTAEDRVTLLENAVSIAGEVFDSRKKLRESGKETAINVLDAESEVFSSQINYVGALYDARLASYDLLRAMGKLEIAALGPPGVNR